MTADMAYVVPQWTFGDRVRKARGIAGLDQREFSTLINVKPGTLAQWESDRARPRDIVAVAKRIELAVRVHASWVLGLDGTTPDGGGSSANGSDPVPFS
jgi:transcriptional regulator with XRE-family HTH domain